MKSNVLASNQSLSLDNFFATHSNSESRNGQ